MTDSTGDARVDAVLERLAVLDQTPVSDHVAVFADVHRGLHEALTALDES